LRGIPRDRSIARELVRGQSVAHTTARPQAGVQRFVGTVPHSRARGRWREYSYAIVKRYTRTEPRDLRLAFNLETSVDRFSIPIAA